MKKLFILSILLFFSVNISAQSLLRNGTYSISGNISYSSISNDNSSYTRSVFTFNPNVGYFFYNNFYTALSLDFSYVSDGIVSRTSYGFGPTVRYYFDANRALKPFLGLGYNYSVLSKDVSSDNFIISGGSDFFVTNYFALEASVNYSFINYHEPANSYSGDTKSNMFNVMVGVNYFIH